MVSILPTSVRRVVAAAPQTPVVASLASGAAFGLSPYKSAFAQRRYSSSKPSSPDDGSRAFAARPSVPSATDSKTSGEKKERKRKAKAPAAPQLPSVPPTAHIKDEAFALSTFFALHRPISVTHTLPKHVTDDAFANIFSHRSKGHKVTDVLSTLSQTVHDLEQPGKDHDDGSTKLSLRHADGTETNVYIQLNSMSGNFLPFNPPPPPKPLSDMIAEREAENAALSPAEEAATEQMPQSRVYKAVVTIEETVDADGQYKVLAHSPQLVEDGDPLLERQPRTFLERLAQRQLRYEDAREHADYYTISVKRQKKLRMKKRKYKKLMRRTRNIRQKLNRL